MQFSGLPHRFWQRLMLSGALYAALIAPARSQEKQPPKVGGAEVTPSPKQPPSVGGAEVTPSELSAAPDFPQPDFDPFSQSFPDLSQQMFGGGGSFGEGIGVLRGATMGNSLFDTPMATDILSRQELEAKQAPDMFHALQQEVGVLMQRTAAGQASPYIRGMTGQQVLILVDGIRLNNSVFRFGANQYFNTIDPGMVDHLEVVRGGGGVLWGSGAHGGVINVVTRSADARYGLCCGDYGQREVHEFYNTADSSSYSRANVEGWAGGNGVFAGGSWLNVRDLDTGFDQFGRQPGTNYQQYAGDVKYNYLIDRYNMITVALQHFEQEDVPRSDRMPGFPLDRGSPNSPGNMLFFDPQQRDLAYVRYQALYPTSFIDALTFTTSYHRQREVQTTGLVTTTRTQETDVETTGLQVNAAKDLGHLGRLLWGADWYHDDVDSAFSGTATGPIIPDDAWYQTFGVFLHWDVQLTCNLRAEAGVRYESVNLAATPVVAGQPIHIDAEYHDWIGYAGLTCELTDNVNLVSSISEGFRAPNLDDLTANNPNVLQQGQDLPSLGLRPEHSYTYEVGIKSNFDRLRTQTMVFWTQFDDDIVRISAGANQFNRANHDAFFQGVEFDGEYLLGGGWSLYGNYWYVFARDEVANAPMSKVPPDQGILGLRWRDVPTHSYFSIYAWMVSQQDRLDPVVDASDERIPVGGTPGYATLNMRYGTALGNCQQHRLSVSLENITDKGYLVHGSGVLGTGFTARLGYSWVH
jgi:hemoglobin/transferrin/lactoferrin receptor protein